MINKIIKLYGSNKNRNYILFTQIINTIIGLISGKLIAVNITPEDFGLYNIQFATYSFVSTLLLSPFIQYIKTTSNSLLAKVGSKFYFYTFFSLLFFSYMLLVSFLYFFYNISNLRLYCILFFFMLFASVFNIAGDFYMIKSKLIVYSKYSVFKSFFALVFIGLTFYFGLNWFSSVELLWAMQVFGIGIALLFFGKHYQFFKSKIKVGYVSFFKKYFKFSLPLILLAFWSWINNFFDRYALEYLLDLKDVGIYNANYGIGSKFFLLLSPMFLILITPQVYALVKVEIKKKAIIKYSKYYAALGVLLLCLIFISKEYIGQLLLAQPYKEGFYLIFWMALAFFILTLTHLFESIFYSEKKTKIILYSNIFSAVINIAANIILIPIYGILGAALATLMGFTIQFFIIFYNFNKL